MVRNTCSREVNRRRREGGRGKGDRGIGQRVKDNRHDVDGRAKIEIEVLRSAMMFNGEMNAFEITVQLFDSIG